MYPSSIQVLGPAALEGLQGAKSVKWTVLLKCDSGSTPVNIESESASK